MLPAMTKIFLTLGAVSGFVAVAAGAIMPDVASNIESIFTSLSAKLSEAAAKG